MANNRKPTFRELSSVWKRMAESNSPSFHQRDINNAVEDAVLTGDLPREAADYAKVLAVYAEELIRERGRPQGGTGKETKRVASERHFVGGEHEADTSQERELLDVSRTSEKPGVKPVRLAGPDLDPEDADLLRKSLAGKSGKALASMVINEDQASGLRRSSVEKPPHSGFIGPMPAIDNPLEKLRPRAERPEPKPAPRGSAEAQANRMVEAIKRSGMDVSEGSIPGKSGKGVFFGFKNNPKVARFYSPEILEEVLGAGAKGSDVFAGVGEDGKSVFDILNARAKGGDMDAAAAFELLKRKHFKTGERSAKARERTTEPVLRPVKGGGFEPVTRTNEKGEEVPVTEIRGPEDKARRKSRNESRSMGQTASEAAFRRSKFDPERVGGSTSRNMSVDQAMIAREIEAQRRTDPETGEVKQGPLTKEVYEQIRRMAKEPGRTPEAPLDEIIAAFKKARARKRTEVPDVMFGKERLAKQEDRPRSDFVGPMPLRKQPVDPKYLRREQSTGMSAESEGGNSRRLQALERLRNIILSRGGVMDPRDMGPHQAPRMTSRYGPAGLIEEGEPVTQARKSVPERRAPRPRVELVRSPKANRKPINKRPGKGPGIKEKIFSMMANARRNAR
jgi:hypothetical protein